MDNIKPSQRRDKLLREAKELLSIFLYLAVFFCTFLTYRRLLMRELGISYLHYGMALVKAIVLAKVILLGRHTRLARRLDERPLIIPTLYKIVIFSLYTLAFEILEHIIESLVHGKPITDAFGEMLSVGRDELLARTLVTLVALFPLIAFIEIGRILGEGSLYVLFFKKRLVTSPTKQEPNSE